MPAPPTKVLNPLEVSVIANGDHREITILDARSMDFESLEDLSSCIELKRIVLAKNKISDLSGIRHNESLEYVDASHNSLESFPDDMFVAMKQLRFLNLSHNLLTRVSGLSPKARMTALLLNHNALKQLPNLRGFTSLKTLVASHNQLDDLSKCSLLSLSTLQKLSLSNNKLVCVPKGIELLHDLEELRLNRNNIGQLPEKLEFNSRLKLLDLGHNKLRTFSQLEVLARLPSLLNLNLGGNPVCELPNYDEKIREMLPHLIVLDSRRVGATAIKKTSAKRARSDTAVSLAKQEDIVESAVDDSKAEPIELSEFLQKKKPSRSGIVSTEIVSSAVCISTDQLQAELNRQHQLHEVGVPRAASAWDEDSDGENVTENVVVAEEPPSENGAKSSKPVPKKRRRQRKKSKTCDRVD